jgi:hypothetical protein
LFDQQGLLRPIEIAHLELRHFRYSQATPKHQEEQGTVHRVVDLGKQLCQLFLSPSAR